jgi:small subunit ribosomal protein S4
MIAVREKSKSLESISESLASRGGKKYAWFEWDSTSLTGKFVNYPQKDEIPENIQVQLIVELYSK